jgi:MFS family permease
MKRILRTATQPQDSWLPMVVIALGQALLAFNLAALSISMGGMVASFETPPTTVGTAIILHALAVSAFILLGAKLGQRFGSRRFFQAAIAMLPFKLAVFFTAILIVRQFSRFTPRQIAGFAITIVAAGALWLAWVVRNDWNTFPMLVGLVAIGLGQGTLATLLFNVLVSASPKELAGDVGALRAAANNLSASVGTASVDAVSLMINGSQETAAWAASSDVAAVVEIEIDVILQVL